MQPHAEMVHWLFAAGAATLLCVLIAPALLA